MHSNSRDRRVTFLLENLDGIAPEKAAYLSLDPDAFDFTWILKYRKKPHARHKIRILLALVCRKPRITAHEKATYMRQDPDLFEFERL